MEKIKYGPMVNLLLLNSSDEKVEVVYNSDPKPIKQPLIGPRPPYYCNPRIGFYYPIA